jgi:hypothetical protein
MTVVRFARLNDQFHRDVADQGKKKRPVTDAAKIAVSVEVKAQIDAQRIETISRTQADLGAAVELVGAVPAHVAMLRVRSVGSLAKCGNLMIGGGTLLDHESSEPKVQWFRSKHGIITSAGHAGVSAGDFEPVPRARSLSYTPSALDAGRLLRLVVWPGEGRDVVWAPAGAESVLGDAKVETNARARVETVRPPCFGRVYFCSISDARTEWCVGAVPAQGVVRESMRAARTGETRTILVQRGESSRVELRDGDGQALLQMPMGLVRTLASSDSPRQPHGISMVASTFEVLTAVVLRRCDRSSLTSPTNFWTQ